MRLRARTDANHAAIMKVLRQAGCAVQDLSHVGNGCPDLLVARNGQTWVIEVKDGSKPPSGRRLTPAEKEWLDGWRGENFVVINEREALATIGVMCGEGLR
jgi:hypothetical protein